MPGEVVIHAYALDKFYGTPLDMILRARDIRYLMVTGLLAHLCVAATVYSANAREYRVTAVTDCITTIWPDILKSVFDIFSRKLARLMTSTEACKKIESNMDNEKTELLPRFKRAFDFTEAQISTLTENHPELFPMHTSEERWNHDGETWTNWCEGFLFWSTYKRWHDLTGGEDLSQTVITADPLLPFCPPSPALTSWQTGHPAGKAFSNTGCITAGRASVWMKVSCGENTFLSRP